ncbi:MAG: hypothetical protein IPN48_14840 [Sphingomonadales bacterium]|nr:hypothetical protein [Sphingomonadales bacterium]
MMLAVRFRHQQADVLTKHLFAAITEHLLCRCAEIGNDATLSMMIIASGTVARIERKSSSPAATSAKVSGLEGDMDALCDFALPFSTQRRIRQ